MSLDLVVDRIAPGSKQNGVHACTYFGSQLAGRLRYAPVVHEPRPSMLWCKQGPILTAEGAVNGQDHYCVFDSYPGSSPIIYMCPNGLNSANTWRRDRKSLPHQSTTSQSPRLCQWLPPQKPRALCKVTAQGEEERGEVAEGRYFSLGVVLGMWDVFFQCDVRCTVYAALPGFSSVSMCWALLVDISPLLYRWTYPNDIVWKPNDLISGPFGHFCKAFCLSLVFERIARKVNSCRGQHDARFLAINIVPDRWTSALTKMLTPPTPSNSISSSLLFLQSPIRAMYVRPVSYSL